MAFPEGPSAVESREQDARVLAAKAAAGADFAVTQLFFRSSDYFALVDRVRAAGSDIPILPGIMPITNLGSVRRLAELSGADVPAAVLARFEGLTEPADVRREGVLVATELCKELLAGGAPGEPPTYIGMCHIYSESVESFQAAFSARAEQILGDIPNYTDLSPVLQISEVVVGRQ